MGAAAGPVISGVAGVASSVLGGGGSSGGMPRWQRRALKGINQYAEQVAGGMRVAPFNQDQLDAQQGVRDLQGYLDSDYGKAMDYAKTLQNGVSAADISSFYNPFEDQVVGSFLNDVNQMHGVEDLRVNDAAEQAKAFGGDREAVYRAVSQGQIDDNAQRNLAGIRSTGYQLASNNAFNNQGFKLAGNAQLQQLIEGRRNAAYQDVGALNASGAQQQAYQQYAYDLPLRQLQTRIAGAGQPLNNPPTPGYDPIAGAMAGFQGGYRTYQDLLAMMRGGNPGSGAYTPGAGGTGPVLPPRI